ncbi:helix-turn-helix transcriptional regulator [Bradyrhizobium sp. CER78]|nr:helix-turn-helix transcriptional regulator [Bradyrhizobium sp. CER78]MDH2384940.1 helix-turn-helix transcriptional regulator [Bradyrhizobium sp. CER78]
MGIFWRLDCATQRRRCWSLHHFARAFRQATGQTPHRFVSVRRLERAKALLTSCERSIVDIALSLGSSSQANFKRAFRQATGHAPDQYRQAVRSQLYEVTGSFSDLEL